MYSRLATASDRIVSLPTQAQSATERWLLATATSQPHHVCSQTHRPNSFLLFADVRVLASLCHVYKLALTLAPPPLPRFHLSTVKSSNAFFTRRTPNIFRYWLSGPVTRCYGTTRYLQVLTSVQTVHSILRLIYLNNVKSVHYPMQENIPTKGDQI